MKKLSFIVVGVQKGGTSTLHKLLRAHPGLAPSRRKELHFFDKEARDWSRPDYGAYHARFAAADPALPWGETTPAYLYIPGCLERIRDYNPDIRLIALFRDPIDRAFSHWCMEYGRGRETMPFAEAIREPGRARVAAAPGGWHRTFSYVERGFYGRQLARLLELFPRRNLLCLDHRLLASDQRGLVDRVARFLGAPRLAAAPRPVHELRRAEAAFPSTLTDADSRHLARLYAADFLLFRRLSGLDCAGWRVADELGDTLAERC